MLFENPTSRTPSLCSCLHESGLCRLKKLTGIQRDTAEKSRENDGQMTGKSRANEGQMTGFLRTINKICVRHFPQSFRVCKNGARRDLDKALAEALQVVRSNDAPVGVTSLARLFRPYARGLQTVCRNRSIMRQNVAEVDCLPSWCVSHNILAIRHLPKDEIASLRTFTSLKANPGRSRRQLRPVTAVRRHQEPASNSLREPAQRRSNEHEDDYTGPRHDVGGNRFVNVRSGGGAGEGKCESDMDVVNR